MINGWSRGSVSAQVYERCPALELLQNTTVRPCARGNYDKGQKTVKYIFKCVQGDKRPLTLSALKMRQILKAEVFFSLL